MIEEGPWQPPFRQPSLPRAVRKLDLYPKDHATWESPGQVLSIVVKTSPSLSKVTLSWEQSSSSGATLFRKTFNPRAYFLFWLWDLPAVSPARRAPFELLGKLGSILWRNISTLEMLIGVPHFFQVSHQSFHISSRYHTRASSRNNQS